MGFFAEQKTQLKTRLKNRGKEPERAGSDLVRTVESSAARLGRLHIKIARKLDGLLHGDYLGTLPGPGSDIGESRIYRPGDDVRRMDWNVTARTTIPHVHTTMADRELETWITLDNSPSLEFGTTTRFKRELAIGAAATFAYITGRGGNRTAAVWANEDGTAHISPPRSGRTGARTLVSALDRATPASTTLEKLVASTQTASRRTGLAVVISDFLDDSDWPTQLKKLSIRHSVICIEVFDPVELELPDVGIVDFIDPETGITVEVQTGSKRFRRKYAEQAAADRAAIAGHIRAAGAAHLQLRTDADYIAEIAAFLTHRRHLNTGR